MTKTFKNESVLLAIGMQKIYGISPSDGELLFEFTTEIGHVIDLVEGCLLSLDSRGRFRLIEIFYETGQILGTWQLETPDNSMWEMEAASVRAVGSKINLFVKLKTAGMRVILVFPIDPICEIATCSFRHWTISSNQDDKSLPFIVKTWPF